MRGHIRRNWEDRTAWQKGLIWNGRCEKDQGFQGTFGKSNEGTEKAMWNPCWSSGNNPGCTIWRCIMHVACSVCTLYIWYMHIIPAYHFSKIKTTTQRGRWMVWLSKLPHVLFKARLESVGCFIWSTLPSHHRGHRLFKGMHICMEVVRESSFQFCSFCHDLLWSMSTGSVPESDMHLMEMDKNFRITSSS